MSEFENVLDDINQARHSNEARSPVYSGEILSALDKNISNLTKLDSWYVANGVVGLFRYERDGNAYEISIKAIQQGDHKNLWGNKIKKRQDRDG